MNAATMMVNAKGSDLSCTPGRQSVLGEGKASDSQEPRQRGRCLLEEKEA